MRDYWKHYLDQQLDLDQITSIVVYTDTGKFWLASGILDLAEKLQIHSSVQIIEEITDEEGMEIQQSFRFLAETTLLVALFSYRNPVITELGNIFPLLSSPIGYSGYSLITHQTIPDQFFGIHLLNDSFLSQEKEETYRNSSFRQNVKIMGEKDTGTYFEAKISSVASFPYHAKTRHLILPSTELIADLDLDSVDGVIKVTSTIGAYYELGELVDPFGKVGEPIELLIERGKLIDIRGEKRLVSRLQSLISFPYQPVSIQLSIGLGPEGEISGFIEHDRLLGNQVTLSFVDTDQSYLEFGIGRIQLSVKR